MFLDMENVNEGIRLPFCNYLIGVVVRSESEERYVSFFAETPTLTEEGKMLAGVLRPRSFLSTR